MTFAQIVALIFAFIVGLLLSRRSAQRDAKILDLNAKIKEKKDEAAARQADADRKVKEYEESLKKYDPDFNGDDDSGGHNA